MKSVTTILCFSALTTAAFAQGLVTFGNGPTTLISYGGPAQPAALVPANGAAEFYFGLLTSYSASGPFTFAGVYGTNSASAGRIAPYTTSVPGWAPGATMFYEIAGWSASLGTVFNYAWLSPNYISLWSGYFGVSSVASGVAGGITPPAELSVSISGDSIVISWTAAGGTLESSPALGAGETWSTVGTANPAMVTISGNARFFRVVTHVYPPLDLFGPSGLHGFNLIPINVWI